MHTLIPQIAGPLQAGMDRGAASGQDAEQGLLVAYDLRNVTDPGNRSNPKEGSPANGGGQVATETDLSTAISPVTHGKTTDRGTRIVTGAQVYAIGAAATRENPDHGPVGLGLSPDLAYTHDTFQPQAVAFESRFARNGRGAPSDVVPPLKAQSGQSGKGDAAPLVAFAQNQRDEVRVMDLAGALPAEPGMKQQTYLASTMQVRRITPTEAERLQGFPDGWTAIPFRGKTAADGPRYKALGNSFAVPCVAWIGKRIQMVVDMESA